jgi:hypothetical protein
MKLIIKFLGSLFFILLIAFVAKAQDTTLKQHYFTLRHDNDFLNLAGQGTDRYYTAGAFLEYSFLAKKNLLEKLLISTRDSLPSFFTIGVTQWIYTPNNIGSETVQQNDYPYSGVLFFHLDREKILSAKKIISSSVWLGIIGPAAMASQFQNLVHHVIHGEIPEGWENQMPDYPVINYNFLYQQVFLPLNHFALSGFSYTQAGSLLNTEKLGMDISFSTQKGDWFPERLYVSSRKDIQKKFKFFILLKPSAQFVATNGMLEGSLFEKKDFYHIADSDIERLIYELSGTLGLRYHNFTVSYIQNKQSKLFKTVYAHSYGSVVLSFRI